MNRKNCVVSYIQFVADQHGFLVVLCFKHSLMLGDAKMATNVLFNCLPDKTTCRATQKGLRPLDEVDADRSGHGRPLRPDAQKERSMHARSLTVRKRCAMSSRGSS